MKAGRLILLACIVIIVAAASLTWLAQTNTPQFRTAAGQVLPNSIAEERMVELGDTQQYILLRGINRDNPILIYLHGGPGTSGMPFNRVFNAPLEQDFLFVNWDQRGTGFSLEAGADRSSLTLSRMTKDLDELIDKLRAEFDKEKVILVGHSWGSMLGLNYVSKHPGKVIAYVGLGQMAQTRRSETLVYNWAKEQALANEDQDAIETLDSIGPPPYSDVTEMMAHRSVVNRYGGAWQQPFSDLDYGLTAIRAPEFSWTGIPAILEGADISLHALFDEFTALDAMEQFPSIDAPVYFFLGRGDQVVATEPAVSYFEKLDAPVKKLVWFENSAHSPHWEEPEKFMEQVKAVADNHAEPS